MFIRENTLIIRDCEIQLGMSFDSVKTLLHDYLQQEKENSEVLILAGETFMGLDGRCILSFADGFLSSVLIQFDRKFYDSCDMKERVSFDDAKDQMLSQSTNRMQKEFKLIQKYGGHRVYEAGEFAVFVYDLQTIIIAQLVSGAVLADEIDQILQES